MQAHTPAGQLHPTDQLLVFTNLFTFHATQASTNGTYAVFEEGVPPLGGPPPHTHPDEEVFYVLSGDFEFVLHDLTKPFKVARGEVVQIPSNALHTYKNVGQSVGKLLTIISPGNLEQYFRAIGTEVKSKEEMPDLNLPPDLAKLDLAKAFAIAADHQVHFYLPAFIKS
ncbi:cupin domain-containing protein [Cesiribacter sp. SM1]|uniref:cupin domain-containing protein n=1 Tax=Cesiribacter sp. SM1 TaxID=2861196 RepID=UPI001CD3EB04|nr:cupin domain-containing protein [Cesiribacter sp. SM1]